MFSAVYKFEEGKYEEALDGDDNADGFEQIIRQYGKGDAVNIARLYAATSWLKLYNILFDREKCKQGINHLKFSNFDYLKILEEKKDILLGDLYVESGLFNDGAISFLRAEDRGVGKKFRPYYLFKASLALQEDGRTSQAIDALKKIIKNFPDHPYAQKARQRLATLK